MTAKDNPASKLRRLECLFVESSRPDTQTKNPLHIPTCFIYIISYRHSPSQSLSQLKAGEDIRYKI